MYREGLLANERDSDSIRYQITGYSQLSHGIVFNLTSGTEKSAKNWGI